MLPGAVVECVKLLSNSIFKREKEKEAEKLIKSGTSSSALSVVKMIGTVTLRPSLPGRFCCSKCPQVAENLSKLRVIRGCLIELESGRAPGPA